MRRSSNRPRGRRIRDARKFARARLAARTWAGRSRTGPQTDRAPSVRVVGHRRLEELRPQLRVRLVVATPERGPGARVTFPHSPHLGAKVQRVQVDSHAMRLEDADELVGDLDTDPFLD